MERDCYQSALEWDLVGKFMQCVCYNTTKWLKLQLCSLSTSTDIHIKENISFTAYRVQTDQNLLDQKQIFRNFFTNTKVQAGDLTAKWLTCMCSSTLPLHCIYRNITTIEPVQFSPQVQRVMLCGLQFTLKESQNNLHSEEEKHLCTADTKRK